MNFKCLVLGIALTASVQAWATLGGTADSVETDRRAISAKSAASVTSNSLYSVHEINRAGTIVREYVSSRGVVFAVTWRGQTIPDLQSLLGSYFEEYADAREAQGHTRAPQLIKSANMIVHHGGHMRALHGYAQLPLLVPAGVNVEKLP